LSFAFYLVRFVQLLIFPTSGFRQKLSSIFSSIFFFFFFKRLKTSQSFYGAILYLSSSIPLSFKKGVPLNIQTRTVLSIHDPVNEYGLKLFPEIYELICLGHVGVLS
jgi:hypothetical protein